MTNSRVFYIAILGSVLGLIQLATGVHGRAIWTEQLSAIATRADAAGESGQTACAWSREAELRARVEKYEDKILWGGAFGAYFGLITFFHFRESKLKR